MEIINKIDNILSEASLKAELKKAFMRIDTMNDKKIARRTQAMKNPIKLIAWALALEDQNFHDEVQKAAERYAELTGKNLLNTPEWRKGISGSGYYD